MTGREIDTDGARDVRQAVTTRRLDWAGRLIGFGLGGFFDGILLHQILQWHHLLSGLDGGVFRDVRVQILADGLFHALMYVIAAIGFWLLLRARRGLGAPGAARRLVGEAAIGFGAWHVTDAVLSHWLLQIHRIRMDSDIPLAWDIGWLVVFGIGPIVLGWALRRDGGTGHPRRGGGRAAAALLALATLGAGSVAGRPPADATSVMVLFRPGLDAPGVLSAAKAVDARVTWSDPSQQLWAFELPEGASPLALWRHGALFVVGTGLSGACLSWSRPGPDSYRGVRSEVGRGRAAVSKP